MCSILIVMNLVAGLREGRFLGLKVGSLKPLLFLALILIAVLLRAGNLGEFRPMDPDEVSWLMVGTSLIKTGKPTAWTMFGGAYGKAGIAAGETVTPYLDHPPLFSLLVGGWAYWLGETNAAQFNWELVRIPMIVISVLTIIVTWLFVRRVFGGTMANFVLLAFVFFPTHVVTSRIIAAEHLIGLLLILGLYLFAVFETTEKKGVRRATGTGMALLCVVSLMIKLSAVVIPATLCFLALYRRRWYLGVLLVLSSAVSVLLLLGYGYYYDWAAFVNVVVSHNGRPQNLAYFWTIFTSLDIGNYGMYDPSVIVGFIGVVSLAIWCRIKANAVLIFTPMLAISFLFLYVAPESLYGWYKYLAYPLMAIGLGYVFTQLYRQKYEYLVFFLPLVSMMLQHSQIFVDQDDRRIAVAVFYVVAVLPVLLKNRWWQLRPSFISLLMFLFAFEVMWVLRVLAPDLFSAR